ncbi:MAG: type IV pilus biogenesis/stability protein PilW [Leucothrix sp.]
MNKKIITIKTITIFLTLLFSLTACSSGNQSKPPPQKSQASSYNARLGAEYTRKGRLNLANEKLLKALEQNPNSADANHYYALLQQKLGLSQKADIYFRKALAITPKNPDLLNNYGSYLCQNGQYRTATQHFMAAITDPLYTTPEFAYTNAGICIRKSGDLTTAEQYFRKSLALKPTFASALYQMAKVKYEQGDYSRAQAFLQRYHERNPEVSESLSLCVQINRRLGDLNAAGQCRSKLAGRFQS